MVRRALHPLALARDDPRLRPSQHLVARKERQRRAIRRAPLGHRLRRETVRARIEQASAPQIVQDGDATPRADFDKLPQCRRVREPNHAEVGCVDGQNRACIRADCVLEIPRVSAVRRPDFHDTRAALRENVGDAESAADFHRFAARHDNLFARRHRRQRERDGGCVVVHRQPRLRAGGLPDEVGDPRLPRPALAGGEVELQIAVPGRRHFNRAQTLRAQRRAPQIGMQNNPRGVDDAPGPSRPPRRRALRDGVHDFRDGRSAPPAAHLIPRRRQRIPNEPNHRLPRKPSQKPPHARMRQNAAHRGNVSELGRHSSSNRQNPLTNNQRPSIVSAPPRIATAPRRYNTRRCMPRRYTHVITARSAIPPSFPRKWESRGLRPRRAFVRIRIFRICGIFRISLSPNPPLSP